MASNYSSFTNASTDDDGDLTTTTYSSNTVNGQTTSASFSIRTVEDGGSTEFEHRQAYDSKGNTISNVVRTTNTDEDGNVTGEVRSETDAKGTTTTTTTDENGHVRTTVVDKDGKVISDQTVDAKGQPVATPEEEKSEFWDPDIIYGEPDLEILEDRGGKDGLVDMKMMLEMDPSLEMYVDQFDFIM